MLEKSKHALKRLNKICFFLRILESELLESVWLLAMHLNLAGPRGTCDEANQFAEI